MTTACPCFGRNENCKLCEGTGIVRDKVEAKVLSSYSKPQPSFKAEATPAQIASFTPAVRERQYRKRLSIDAEKEAESKAKLLALELQRVKEEYAHQKEQRIRASEFRKADSRVSKNRGARPSFESSLGSQGALDEAKNAAQALDKRLTEAAERRWRMIAEWDSKGRFVAEEDPRREAAAVSRMGPTVSTSPGSCPHCKSTDISLNSKTKLPHWCFACRRYI